MKKQVRWIGTWALFKIFKKLFIQFKNSQKLPWYFKFIRKLEFKELTEKNYTAPLSSKSLVELTLLSNIWTSR